MSEVTVLDDDVIDFYADVVAEVARCLARCQIAEAALKIAPIAGQFWMGRVTLAGIQGQGNAVKRARKNTSAVAAEVFARDGFRCTFCTRRAVPLCVLVAISDVFPDELPYYAHYARGTIHPVYMALACEADHTFAHSRGGGDGIDNLTTMHAYCNTRKGDSLIADLPDLPAADNAAAEGWDGLISLYPRIVAAGELRGRRHSGSGYHRQWMRRYGLTS